MEKGKKFQREKLGEPGHLNGNCWLVKTLNYTPYKRCQHCELKFHHCLFLHYQIISLILILFLFILSFLIEGKISELIIISVFALVIVYGYFFNKSTDKIIQANFAQRKATEALEELTEKLEEKVDAQTRDLRAKNVRLANLAHDLEKANLRLQEIDRQKTEFLSIASHQLRTPLSILKGYTELMKDGVYGQPTKGIVKILDEMDENNERLVKLVDEFLDITKIEQGRTKFDFAPCSVDKIIGDVIKEISEQAEKKGIMLKEAVKSAVPQINADKEKIYHIIFNFVDNAIKYSEKGIITISLKEEKRGLAVRVNDEGIGFGKVDKANFFQKFYRGNNVRKIAVNGTGLGLFVCSKFIEEHGGRIWAHSKGIGKGSEFGFWIPITNINKI